MSPVEQFNAFSVIVRREFYRILRIWPQTLLPPIITMNLYFLIFGRVIGSRISSLHSVPYILFITPGLIIMSVLNNAYINSSSSFFGNKFSRAIDEILISPTPCYLIALGFTVGAVFRGLLIGFFVTLVGMIYTPVHIHHIVIFIYTMVVAAFIFSLAGLLNGIVANKFDDVAWVPSFIILPMTYLGGVFYSITMLPPAWQRVMEFNPMYYIVSLFRYSMLNIRVANEGLSLIILTAVSLAMFFWVTYMLKYSKRLRY
jgi:ABC-2 type transport system permease protein